jgi:hypothetical protein
MQTPFWQESGDVQAWPSSQPSPFAIFTHAPAEQVWQVPHAEPTFCQTPFASHIWGCIPSQPGVLGAQVPAQEPVASTQTY